MLEYDNSKDCINSESLICPYCGHKQLSHEPENITSYASYEVCEHCDRGFWYTVKVTREYSSSKDEALENGSEK